MAYKSRIYYWVWGILNGKKALLGAFGTEIEAEQEGFKIFPQQYEVIPLNTKDVSTASRILRARIMDEEDNPFQRFKHKL